MTDQALTFRVQAEVAQAKSALSGLSGDFQKLGTNAKAAMRDAAGGGGLANGFDMLRASIDPAFASAKRYQQVQSELAGMVERGEASQAAANIVLEQAARQYMGVATAAERAAAAERGAAAATSAAAREAADLQARFVSLRASVDPAYAALLRYTDAKRISDAAVRAGVATEQEAAATLTALQGKYTAATGAAKAFATSQSMVTRGLMSSTAMTGNVTAQFNDIGVMLAAGQNPFQLAIQQGTQLSQVFQMMRSQGGSTLSVLKAGLLGLISPTTLLTVATIAAGAALFQWATGAGEAEGKAKKVKTANEQLAEAVDRVTASEKAAGQSIEQLTAKYGAQAEAMRKVLSVQLEIDKGNAARASAAASSDIAGNIGASLGELQRTSDLMTNINRNMAEANRLQREAESVGGSDPDRGIALQRRAAAFRAIAEEQKSLLAGLQTDVQALADAYGITFQEASRVAEANAKIKAAAGLREQIAAGEEMVAVLKDIFGGYDQANVATGGLVDKLAEAVRQQIELAKATGDAGTGFSALAAIVQQFPGYFEDARAALEAMVGAQPGPDWLGNAIDRTDTLIGKLWDAAVAASQIPAVSDEKLAGAYGLYGMTRRNAPAKPVVPKKTGGGGGGGGPATGSFADLSGDAKKTLADLDIAIAAINEKVKAGLMTTAEAVTAVSAAHDKANNDLASVIAQIAKLGPAGAAAADELRTHLTALSKPISDLSKSLAVGLTDPLAEFVKGTATAGQAFTKMGDMIIDKLVEIAMQQAQVSFFEPLIQGLFGGSGFGKLIGSAFGFASGGYTGDGDTGAPAGVVHGQEFVVNAKATEKNRGLLEMLNSGKSPRLAMPAVPSVADRIAGLRPAPRVPALRSSGGAQGGGSGGNHTVVITPPAGHQAKVTERETGGDFTTEVIFEAIDARLAERLGRGVGPTAGMLQEKFGMRRTPR